MRHINQKFPHVEVSAMLDERDGGSEEKLKATVYSEDHVLQEDPAQVTQSMGFIYQCKVRLLKGKSIKFQRGRLRQSYTKVMPKGSTGLIDAIEKDGSVKVEHLKQSPDNSKYLTKKLFPRGSM